MINSFPVKEKSNRKRERFFNYLIVEQNNKIYVNQRTGKDIWQNLYEFILIETASMSTEEEFLNAKIFTSLFARNNYTIAKVSAVSTQQLTHQKITGRFFHIAVKTSTAYLKKYKMVSMEEFKLLPFPKFINSYLKD